MKKVNVSTLLPLIKSNQRVSEIYSYNVKAGSNGWNRIGEFDNMSDGAAMFSVYNGFYTTPPGSSVFVLGKTSSSSYFSLIHRHGGPISKVGIVTTPTKAYIEVFITSNGVESLEIFVDSARRITLYSSIIPGVLPSDGSRKEYSL